MEKMKIARIKIRNILGIAEYEFEPGQGFTEISGRNGVGKTSVLEAVKAIARGGHDATLLTNGATEGEIVYVLDDGMEITKAISADSTDMSVRMPGAKRKAPRPGEIVKNLIDQLSNNPIDLLRAKPKERAKILLESMPIDVDVARLSGIVGFDVVSYPGVHGLHIIDDARKQVFDARTGTNRALDEKKKTIKQLRDVIPEGVGDVTGGEDELEAQLAAIDAEKDAELTRIDGKLSDIRKASQEAIDQVRSTTAKGIEELRGQIAEIQQAIAHLQESGNSDVENERAKLAEIEKRAAMQRQRTLDTHTDSRAPFMEQLSAIRADRDAAAKREQALATIETLETELQVLVEESASQTAALSEIDTYKLELLAGLPIPDLEVRGEDILRNGVLFDRLNTQQQVEVAIEVAKMRAGKLGVVCVDGLELMDSDHYSEFQEQAVASGLQFFASRVTDGEFEVRTS